jgi:hypothetical protein
MITVPAGIRVLVATNRVDFRRGADSLAALVREQLRPTLLRSSKLASCTASIRKATSPTCSPNS